MHRQQRYIETQAASKMEKELKQQIERLQEEKKSSDQTYKEVSRSSYRTRDAMIHRVPCPRHDIGVEKQRRLGAYYIANRTRFERGHPAICVCFFIEWHISAQPCPVKLIFQCYSNGSPLWGISRTLRVRVPPEALGLGNEQPTH